MFSIDVLVSSFFPIFPIILISFCKLCISFSSYYSYASYSPLIDYNYSYNSSNPLLEFNDKLSSYFDSFFEGTFLIGGVYFVYGLMASYSNSFSFPASSDLLFEFIVFALNLSTSSLIWFDYSTKCLFKSSLYSKDYLYFYSYSCFCIYISWRWSWNSWNSCFTVLNPPSDPDYIHSSMR
jgi:hypothetical protein